MNKEKNIIKQLEKEGFTNITVVPLPANFDSGEHTHEEHTVHIILEGELTITDKHSTHTYKQGDRVEFKAGTTHQAKSKSGCKMIIGVKK